MFLVNLLRPVVRRALRITWAYGLFVAEALAQLGGGQAPRATRQEIEQAVANLTLHACLTTPPANKATRPTVGQYYVVRAAQIVTYGNCTVTGPSWVWVERIATDYSVPVTPRGTAGAGLVVGLLQSVQAARVAPRPVTAADFDTAVRNAAPYQELGGPAGAGSGRNGATPLPFVFPPGLFPDEASMLARGAGQPVACPGGTTWLPVQSVGFECVANNSLASFAAAGPLSRILR